MKEMFIYKNESKETNIIINNKYKNKEDNKNKKYRL